ncbi:hypothetical protein FIBSPDRAFT_1050299 [Athelia psychrophila]|uniref:Uncharacterized protein n=1 Tax=Athelia psychrophila TaxID=1759441 RepID=A0A166B025_9AGAM|nr:hypothetical protein FIBSPDRAFT_1050299 [Fibularhizoctonia sp. CBS 109695]
MLGALRTWRKKDKALASIDETPRRTRPRQSSNTLPREMAYHSNAYAYGFPVQGSSRRPARPASPLYPDVFSANPEPVDRDVRPRSRSVGAQQAPPLAASHSFPLVTGNTPDLPPLPSPAIRPPRKSSLLASPIVSPVVSPVTSTFGHDVWPNMARMSTSSSVQSVPPSSLRSKRSAPDLSLYPTHGSTPIRYEPTSPRASFDTPVKGRSRAGSIPYDAPSTRYEPTTPRDFDDTPVKGRSRAESNASYSSQRYREASPGPRSMLSTIPSGTAYQPPIDLTSPTKSRFQAEMAPLIVSRPGTASSLAYLKEGASSSESSHLSHPEQYPPDDPDGARSETPGSILFDDDTLSLFPQPPPLNIRYIPSRPASPSQFSGPLTPDYTPTATPTSATSPSFFPSPHHTRRTSPPTSILKRPTGYLPSPPITPNTPSELSPSLSSSSFASSFNLPEQPTPTLRVRNSSPQLLTNKLHNVHRPSSSDSSSDKYGYQFPLERTDYDLRKRALSRPEKPKLLDAFNLAAVEESLPQPRAYSPEPDSQGVQWGYAV